MRPRPVVVGVDGSAAALEAVRWAARWARRENLPLRLVHAYDRPLGFLAESADTRHEAAGAAGKRWLAAAAAAAREVDPAPSVRTVLVANWAAAALLHESATASLIVLGTRGRSALTGLLVGATSITIARHASAPVVIVRGAGPDEPPRTTGPVVVGVGGDGADDGALGFAFAEAAAGGAELVAVHAWTEATAERAEEFLDERLRGWREKYPAVRVVREVVRDRPSRAMERAALTARLVVVGRQDRCGYRSLTLGHTSQHLMHHVRCPIAVAPNLPTD